MIWRRWWRLKRTSGSAGQDVDILQVFQKLFVLCLLSISVFKCLDSGWGGGDPFIVHLSLPSACRTTSSNLFPHCPGDLDPRQPNVEVAHLQLKTQPRSMASVITLFVIPRFEFHNECVQMRREEKKWIDVWRLSKSMSFNSPPLLSAAKGHSRAFGGHCRLQND